MGIRFTVVWQRWRTARWPVKRQLAAGFGLLAAVVVLVSGVALHSLRQANARFLDHVNGAARHQSLAADLQVAANRRALAVRNLVLVMTAEDIAAEKAAVLEGNDAVRESLAALKEAVSQAPDATVRDRELVADIDKVEASYGPIALEIMTLATTNKNFEATDRMNSEDRPLLAALLKASSDYIAYRKERTLHDTAVAGANHLRQRTLLLAVCAVSALLAAVLGWSITRRLTAALGADPADLGAAARQVAEGDLRPVADALTVPADSVLASMVAMQLQLVRLIGQVRCAADHIASGSSQIAQGNSDLSVRTEEQASNLAQTAASMQQLGLTVQRNADSALHAHQLAQRASQVAARGSAAVSQVVEAMAGINSSSQRISDIIGVIDVIAFQTNILALNAAVESARAGELGRGFAVVAGEVRHLAKSSAEAAKEIKGLVLASVERVEAGCVLVDHVGATVLDMLHAIQQLADIVRDISVASVEQSSSVGQVQGAVNRIDEATQQNAALVEESAAAAESLSQQAHQLLQAVQFFKLDDQGPDQALDAASPIRK